MHVWQAVREWNNRNDRARGAKTARVSGVLDPGLGSRVWDVRSARI